MKDKIVKPASTDTETALATRLTAIEKKIEQAEAEHAAVADAYHQRFRALYRHHQNRIEAHREVCP